METPKAKAKTVRLTRLCNIYTGLTNNTNFATPKVQPDATGAPKVYAKHEPTGMIASIIVRDDYTTINIVGTSGIVDTRHVPHDAPYWHIPDDTHTMLRRLG